MVEEAKKEAGAPASEPAARSIVVANAFVYTDDKGERRHFAPGVHEDVPAAVADHWYVKAHLSKDGKVPYAGGRSQANDDAEKRRLQARIEEQDTALQSAREAAERSVLEQTALKARAEGAEAGIAETQPQILALRKRVTELEADNAALQVRAEKAERTAADSGTDSVVKPTGKVSGKGV